MRLFTVLLLCLALATLGQAPVMWHAGTDILRSKSLDRNSYNSGDWFNFLDWTMTDNGFGAGLPPHDDNGPKWSYFQPFLADPAQKPSPFYIEQAHLAALAVVALAQAAHGVGYGAVLKAVLAGKVLQGLALLAQAVLDLVAGGGHGSLLV